MAARIDSADYFWAKVDANPLPPAPPGETARQAVDRHMAWMYFIIRDSTRQKRTWALAFALDAMSPEQIFELRCQELAGHKLHNQFSIDELLAFRPVHTIEKGVAR